jgi:hypothetical protein
MSDLKSGRRVVLRLSQNRTRGRETSSPQQLQFSEATTARNARCPARSLVAQLVHADRQDSSRQAPPTCPKRTVQGAGRTQLQAYDQRHLSVASWLVSDVKELRLASRRGGRVEFRQRRSETRHQEGGRVGPASVGFGTSLAAGAATGRVWSSGAAHALGRRYGSHPSNRRIADVSDLSASSE